MADEENKIKKWIHKWKKDTDTEQEKLHTTQPEDNMRQAENNLRQGEDRGTLEEKLHTTQPEDNMRQAENNLRQAEENFRQEAATVDEDRASGDSLESKKPLARERAGVRQRRDNSMMVEKGRVVINRITHKPVVFTLIIVAIVLGGFLLYSQMQLSNQSYKVQNFNANWNQSLADLRNGTTSLTEYCNNRVHDEDLCNRFMNLQYMN